VFWTAHIDDWVSRAREQQRAVLRQTQAEYAAFVRLDHSPPLVRVEAVDLLLLAEVTGVFLEFCTRISPPWVPANMYCDDTANARMDLSCFMRCDNAGVRFALGTGFATPFVPHVISSGIGAATGIVSLALGVPLVFLHGRV
jgi:hypothetical protein